MLPEPKKWPEMTSPSAEAQARKASEFVDAQVSMAPTRRLMTALRDLMRAADKPEHKLDQIVKMLAVELRADDCACYVLRAGEVLELYSSSSHPPGEEYQARLRVGEGQVGDVAATAAPVLSDRKST